MKKTRKAFLICLAIALIFSLYACTTTSKTTTKPVVDTTTPKATTPQATSATQGSRIDGATMEIVRRAKPLETTYSNIVFKRFEIPEHLEKDYPDAVTMCKLMIISHLRRKNVFANVMENSMPPYPIRTMLIDGKIKDMRIASSAARIWGGAFAGSSFMEVRIRLTDAASKKTFHEKVIASTNNAFAAAWSMGANDKSLPTDMGRIVGEYIYTIIPAQP